jgi:hypothetical protein
MSWQALMQWLDDLYETDRPITSPMQMEHNARTIW